MNCTHDIEFVSDKIRENSMNIANVYKKRYTE